MRRPHVCFCRYDKFSFDITDALAANGGVDGTHELAVRVFDPTEFAHIPIGKQRRHPSRHPSSIWYTSSSGIWQSVWLEPVCLAPLLPAGMQMLANVSHIDVGTVSWAP